MWVFLVIARVCVFQAGDRMCLCESVEGIRAVDYVDESEALRGSGGQSLSIWLEKGDRVLELCPHVFVEA